MDLEDIKELMMKAFKIGYRLGEQKKEGDNALDDELRKEALHHIINLLKPKTDVYFLPIINLVEHEESSS